VSAKIAWPYTEPHVGYVRYGLRTTSGVLLKGLSLEDAQEMAAEGEGTVMRQNVLYVTEGQFQGTEVLFPWREQGHALVGFREGLRQ
jgi:hypothetical protein